MKPETAAALRKLDLRQSIELVAFMAEIMTPQDFCDALQLPGSGDNLSPDGDPIYDLLIERHGSHLIDPETIDIDGLHEAVCEGRRQDVLDIIEGLTGEQMRPVSAQDRLFPNRAPALRIEF